MFNTFHGLTRAAGSLPGAKLPCPFQQPKALPEPQAPYPCEAPYTPKALPEPQAPYPCEAPYTSASACKVTKKSSKCKVQTSKNTISHRSLPSKQIKNLSNLCNLWAVS